MKRPLIITEVPSEFGALHESPEFNDPRTMARDNTYVPGFSELRRARDEAIAEVYAGRRPASEVPTLPRNFHWARCQNKKGDPDTRKVIGHGNRGYKVVTKDDIGPGKVIESMPAGAVATADGSIRQGDTVLMVAPAESVARNEFTKRVRTESMSRGAAEGFEAACKAAGLRKLDRSEPTTQVEVGQRTQAVLSPISDTVKSRSRQ